MAHATYIIRPQHFFHSSFHHDCGHRGFSKSTAFMALRSTGTWNKPAWISAREFILTLAFSLVLKDALALLMRGHNSTYAIAVGEITQVNQA